MPVAGEPSPHSKSTVRSVRLVMRPVQPVPRKYSPVRPEPLLSATCSVSIDSPLSVSATSIHEVKSKTVQGITNQACLGCGTRTRLRIIGASLESGWIARRHRGVSSDSGLQAAKCRNTARATSTRERPRSCRELGTRSPRTNRLGMHGLRQGPRQPVTQIERKRQPPAATVHRTRLVKRSARFVSRAAVHLSPIGEVSGAGGFYWIRRIDFRQQ